MKQKIFRKSINKLVEGILGNNGLKENLEDYCNKIDRGTEPYFDVLYKLTNSFVIEGISETLFLSDVQTKLNVSEQTAKNILKEIKEKILPSVIILNEDESEKETITSTQSIRQTIESARIIKPSQEIKEKNSGLNTISGVPTKKRQKKIVKPEEIKNIIKQPPQQERKNDKYKEPIE